MSSQAAYADTSAEPGDVSAAAPDANPAEQSPDIIVTGTRRAARLQDVPVSVVAISRDAIRNSGYKAATDIPYIAPGVSFNPQLGAGFTIRGLGTQGFDYNLEKAVGIVVDEVVQGM
ncbi:TonB-dependent receptor plug domain-containing protein, partial [Novosphingobium sp. 9U]|uniref:TonB-dependent receptor plug domain-containing protein n=1 Tax=Novosphingobium sp. 9U TaxID=2653158 RepID=UPI00352BDF23